MYWRTSWIRSARNTITSIRLCPEWMKAMQGLAARKFPEPDCEIDPCDDFAHARSQETNFDQSRVGGARIFSDWRRKFWRKLRGRSL